MPFWASILKIGAHENVSFLELVRYAIKIHLLINWKCAWEGQKSYMQSSEQFYKQTPIIHHINQFSWRSVHCSNKQHLYTHFEGNYN